jgi:predicted ATPase/DNA-binding CsgD family transcriptional regulator
VVTLRSEPGAVPRPSSSWVGRRREIQQVRSALDAARLVTLTGPGGVGKTRLAREVACRTARGSAASVVFVELAELHEDAQLPTLVAGRLGLHNRSGESTLQAVLDHLRERDPLLVLDNCEHLVAASASLAERVLAECPGVVVLATSRQSLGVPGEHVVRVPPLSVPEADAAHRPGELTRYDAVRLLVDRAGALVPGFALTPENSGAVTRICRSLDGLPLAIELAAARVRSLSPQQIADRLTRRLPLLTSGPRSAPERQRTLRATIDWSFELCTPAEQAVWRRAAVFAGSFELDAAEQVCSGAASGTAVAPDGVLDAVDGLIDKSVLLREPHGDVVRYRMPETLREYGHDRLDAAGERAATARRHRDWVDRLTAAADAGWFGPRQLGWAARLRQELPNVRSAMRWCLTEPGEAGPALRIASRLDEYWTYYGHSVEVREWLDRALTLTAEAGPAGADSRDRARALGVCALQSLWHLGFAHADARIAEAEALAGTAEDAGLRAFLTYVRALGAQMRVVPDDAARLARGAAEAFRELGDVRREMHPLWIYGVSVGYRGGDLREGRWALGRMLELSEAHGETRYRAMAQFGLAYLEVERGDDVDAAARLGRRALANLRTMGAGSGTAYVLDALAWIADRQGDRQRAATLFGAAATLWERVGSSPDVALPGPHRAHHEAVLHVLGRERFDRAFAAGRAMTSDDAIAYALDEPVTPPAAPLTRRELEVAGLVAAGLSNREIAAKLVIAQRTVDTHVQNILGKLEFRGRAQIATWFTARQ